MAALRCLKQYSISSIKNSISTLPGVHTWHRGGRKTAQRPQRPRMAALQAEARRKSSSNSRRRRRHCQVARHRRSGGSSAQLWVISCTALSAMHIPNPMGAQPIKGPPSAIGCEDWWTQGPKHRLASFERHHLDFSARVSCVVLACKTVLLLPAVPPLDDSPLIL